MFAELYAVAKHTPLQISVAPEGERLNVLIVPKPGEADAEEGSALTRPIQAIGTPEELDRELPAKLAQYCAAINDLRLRIDLPIEAISAEAAKKGAKKSAAPAVKTPAPATKKTKKKAAPAPVKPQKTAPPVKAAKAPKKAEPHVPGQPVSAEQKAHVSAADAPAAEKKSKRATKEECLADLRTWMSEHKDETPTRAAFVAWAPSGRSYERKWESWEAFIAEGRHQPGDLFRVAQAGGALPPAPDSACPPGAAPLADGAQDAKETLVQTALNPAAKWPFPPAAEPDAGAQQDPAPAAKPHFKLTEGGLIPVGETPAAEG